MPNLYVTPDEIKGVAPDSIKADTTAYNAALRTLAGRISRLIDETCHRQFYPSTETRYFDGNNEVDLYIDDLISITTVSYSDDDGQNYTALTVNTDYIPMRGNDYNFPGSYNKLKINVNSTTLTSWPKGQQSIKIVGVWGYVDDRTNCWEDSQDAVADNPLLVAATTLTVANVDGADMWGITPRLAAGNLIRIESEACEVTASNTGTNTATIIRGRNGTTADEHAQTKQVDVWRVPELIKQAALAQSVHQFKRAQAHYGDAEVDLDMQKVVQLKALVPEVVEFLKPYMRLGFD